jgi:DNA-binding transcriptional ArsR family regulator
MLDDGINFNIIIMITLVPYTDLIGERIDLILHPVRFRILEKLVGERLTTAKIAGQLSDVPKSSIYRPIRLLLEEGMIAVDDTR